MNLESSVQVCSANNIQSLVRVRLVKMDSWVGDGWRLDADADSKCRKGFNLLELSSSLSIRFRSTPTNNKANPCQLLQPLESALELTFGNGCIFRSQKMKSPLQFAGECCKQGKRFL